MQAKLHRYWFTFVSESSDYRTSTGCGVTAFTCDDAVHIIADTIFAGEQMPELASMIEDVSMEALDQGHVIPNMEAHVWRGIWYPKGYAYTDQNNRR